MKTVAPKHLRHTKRKRIRSASQIPENFPSYEAEAEFWETHDIDEGVFEGGPEVREEFFRHLGIDDPAKNRH